MHNSISSIDNLSENNLDSVKSKLLPMYILIFILVLAFSICLVCMFNGFNINNVFNNKNGGTNLAIICILVIILSFSVSTIYYIYGLEELDENIQISIEKPSSYNKFYKYFKSQNN